MNTENNKIIAQFMGFTFEKNLGYYDNDMLLEQIVYDEQNGNCFDELLFYKSWDWLMPVVNKCFENQLFGSNNLISKITLSFIKVDIEVTYNACIEFIKWYNKQSK